MKLTIFSLLAFFSATGSFAQMLPDSIEWYFYDLTKLKYTEFPMSTDHYKYHQNGNMLEEITQAESKNSFKRTYAYSNGKMVDDIRFVWNTPKLAWTPTKRYQKLFNQFGVDTAEIYSTYDTTNSTWVEKTWDVSSIEYDAFNRPTQVTYKVYYVSLQAWNIDRKAEFFYSGADTLPNEVYRATWDGSVWNNERKVSQPGWDLGFFLTSINIYPTKGITNRKDGANWIKYLYDSSVVVNGKVEAHFLHIYNPDSMKYFMYESNHYLFDIHENQNSHVRLRWINGISDTVDVSLNEFDYGSSGEIIERVDRYYNKTAGENKSKYLYYYGATSLVSTERTLAIIYPNPVGAAQKFFIQSEKSIELVRLYAPNGALLRSWNTPNGEGLDIQGIAPGLYFIRLLDKAGNTTTQRLIIK
ncbi:MAG: T9SS type A sorting domain-containing protein [Bacteroidia bacterium]